MKSSNRWKMKLRKLKKNSTMSQKRLLHPVLANKQKRLNQVNQVPQRFQKKNHMQFSLCDLKIAIPNQMILSACTSSIHLEQLKAAVNKSSTKTTTFTLWTIWTILRLATYVFPSMRLNLFSKPPWLRNKKGNHLWTLKLKILRKWI